MVLMFRNTKFMQRIIYVFFVSISIGISYVLHRYSKIYTTCMYSIYTYMMYVICMKTLP